ncbi:unnamed protein product [Lymnaea stagnalis]|uniref:DUF1279 domain-containing protein n=1 Tax=Lymnaea stagnalis TaxID=6523 RepID=A0AAV2HHA4_LYMST
MAFNILLRQGHIVNLTKLFVNKCNGSLKTTSTDNNVKNVFRQGSRRMSSLLYLSKRSLQQHETITIDNIEKYASLQFKFNYKLLLINTASCQRTPAELKRRSSTLNSSASYLTIPVPVVCDRPTLPATNNSRPNIKNNINIDLTFTYSPKYNKSIFSKQFQIGRGLYKYKTSSVDPLPLSTSQIFLGQLRCMTQGSLEPHNQTKIQSEQKGGVINGSSKIIESGEKKDGITPSNGPPDTPKKLSLYQRFKQTYKEHGKILIGVHLVTSAAWFGSFYVAARSGLDIVPYLENWNVSEKVISPFRSGGLGFVAVAYLLYKLATPARYAVTIGGTNLVIRYLRKEGKLKQIPKEDSLRSLYKEGKEDLKRKSKVRIKRLRRKSKMNGKGPQNDK